MKGLAAALGAAVVAGVALGLVVLPSASSSVPPSAAGPVPTTTAPAPVAVPSAGRSAVPTTRAAPACPGAAALLVAYSAGQAGDARSVVVPGSVHCAGPYVAADVRDPSLPDQLNVLFSASPVRRLRSGTGPVCEVGSGEGDLPPITAAQGEVLNCA